MSDYEILKGKYEKLEIEVVPMKISIGVLKSSNKELKRKLQMKEIEVRELSYLITELLKEKNESIRRNKENTKSIY